MTQRTWFITGSSRGFGREWAIAALDRGDRVAATARNLDDLAELVDRYGDAVLPIRLDVTDKAAAMEAVERANAHFGGLDIVVNNAGYGQFGMLEELTEDEARAQIDTNLFGALWITQAAVPIMRERGSGHIIQVSSIGGITASAEFGMYHASKWALEGLSQALAAEVADFGIHVTLVEPAAYATDWIGPSSKHSDKNPAYDGLRRKVNEQRKTIGKGLGDPVATRAAILEVVDAPEPPLRIFFGDGPLERAVADYEQRLATWRQWEHLSIAAHGEPAPRG